MPRRVNLIPMAGAGQRFVEAGFTVPKPLIQVAGVPMIVRAAQSLPDADHWLFVCRQEHIDEAAIDDHLKRLFSPVDIVPVTYLTQGQASTCLLARDYLQPDDVLTIGACDNAMTWDSEAYCSFIQKEQADVIVWTFRQNPAVLQDPRMYGWVETEKGTQARRVSVKVPISTRLMEDHAVIGAFTFTRAEYFLEAADAMIAADSRIKGEFYVDQVVNFAIEQGRRVHVFEVDRYVCWGTPQDLRTFDYWHGYFTSSAFTSSGN